ncbi:hypothetical protein [Bradyrhizobium acaciae]|uniref:hypothetical protein n=1 Tax=Bradyrhizobium acaciae TaxID=2683706 RepID=UPI001E2FDD40|nr:hypothetical protein [Bradyrhizobium acaciae]MCC8978657.1 hypothetical protein [Bradyrhizobium acaciae]
MSTSEKPTETAATIEQPKLSSGATGFFDDLEALKLSQEEMGIQGANEILTRIPVRKPQKHEYFRVRPGDENSFTAVLYEDRETREHYFVAPKMLPLLRAVTDVSVATLVPFITKQKMVGIFPLKVASDATAQSGWQTTAMTAAHLAKTQWIRIQADMALSGYRIFAAEGQLGDPKWPEKPFNELLDLAFKDHVISSQDHPIFNKILGRI